MAIDKHEQGTRETLNKMCLELTDDQYINRAMSYTKGWLKRKDLIGDTSYWIVAIAFQIMKRRLGERRNPDGYR